MRQALCLCVVGCVWLGWGVLHAAAVVKGQWVLVRGAAGPGKKGFLCVCGGVLHVGGAAGSGEWSRRRGVSCSVAELQAQVRRAWVCVGGTFGGAAGSGEGSCKQTEGGSVLQCCLAASPGEKGFGVGGRGQQTEGRASCNVAELQAQVRRALVCVYKSQQLEG